MLATLKSFLYSDNINWGILCTTSIFLIMGIVFFIRRFSNLELRQGGNFRPRQSGQSNNNSDFQNLEDELEIQVQINQERKHFTIRKNENIGSFINTKIKPLINNQNANLIFQGLILDHTKPFTYYQHRMINGSVLLCQIIRGESNNAHHNSDDQDNNNSQIIDNQGVSAFTLLLHLMILSITLFLIFCYQTYREIFDKITIRLIQAILIVWVIFFSESISKLILYRKIVY